MNPIFTKQFDGNEKSPCIGSWDLSSSFKKKGIWKRIYSYFSLSIDASPFLHSEGWKEGRKGRKEGGCLATGILHQTKKKGRKNLLQQRQLLRKGEIPVKLRKLIPTAITPRGSEPPHTRDPLSPAGGNQPPAGTSGYFKPVPFSNPFLFPLNYDATQGRERHTAPRHTTSPFPRPLPSGPRRPPTPLPSPRVRGFARRSARTSRGTSSASHPRSPG